MVPRPPRKTEYMSGPYQSTWASSTKPPPAITKVSARPITMPASTPEPKPRLALRIKRSPMGAAAPSSASSSSWLRVGSRATAALAAWA